MRLAPSFRARLMLIHAWWRVGPQEFPASLPGKTSLALAGFRLFASPARAVAALTQFSRESNLALHKP